MASHQTAEEVEREYLALLGPNLGVLFYHLGNEAKLNEKLDLGLAYAFAWGRTLAIDQQRGPLSVRLAGAYEDIAMHFLGGSLRWTLRDGIKVDRAVRVTGA